MLKEKSCMFCGPRENVRQSTIKCVEMGSKEEMNTRSYG